MGKYALRRIGSLAVTLLFIITLVFAMVRFTGIDPCDIPKATASVRAECQDRWGLNDPLPVQYASYLKKLLQFDLGESYQHAGHSVTSLIKEGFPNTAKLATLALILAFLLGTNAGVIAAVFRNKKTDYIVMSAAMVGIAVPELVAGPLLILVISMKLEFIPRTEGLSEPMSYVLPVITLALPLTATFARLARSGMLEVLGQDYIRTARAKGLSELRVIVRHALRPALTPVVTYLGPATAAVFAGGTFIVEKLFGIPGVGLRFIEASLATPLDYPMIMGTTILLAVLVLGMNLLVDLTYALLDPRLRDAGEMSGPARGVRGFFQSAATVAMLIAGVGGFLFCARLLVRATKPVTEGAEVFSVRFPHLALILSVGWLLLGVLILRSYQKASQSRTGPQSVLVEAWKRLRKHRAAIFSGVALYFIVFACLFGPWFMEMRFKITYHHQVLEESRQAPPFTAWLGEERVAQWRHLLGTDELGRDLLVRMLVGGRVSLSIGVVALVISVIIGVLYGTAAAYFGGRTDNVMMRFVDLLYSVPYMILVIMLVAFVGKSILLLFVAIGFVSWLTLARIARGQVLALMRQEFITAAYALGVQPWRIIVRHLIPNALGPVVVYATRLVAVIILEEAFLSFLGFGVQEPMSSWGILIRDGNIAKESYWWLLLFPAGSLFVTLFGLNFLGDGLRDALDPKLKGMG